MPNEVTANDMPNYRYGVRGAKIALQTAQGTYGTPWIENGAEQIDESGRATTNTTTFYSDDGKPAPAEGATGNDTITVQFAEFSDDYQTKVLGHKIDNNGILVKSKDDEKGVFALGFEVQGTLKKTRVWKLGCTSSEPAAAAFQTKGENATESPESCTLTVAGDTFADGHHDEFVCHEGDEAFDTFLDAVPTLSFDPPVVPVNTKLSTLTIGSLTLSPAFDADIEAYTVTTTNATDAVTATAADSDAEVTIEVNGSEHTSGTAATWESGANTVVVTVSDGEDEPTTNTYIVIVTKE